MAEKRPGVPGSRSSLLALLLALAWLDVSLLMSPIAATALPPGVGRPGADRATQALVDPRIEPRPLDDFREISDRPLFTAGRRLVHAALPAALSEAAAQDPAITLAGVMLRSGRASALLRAEGEKAASWIAVGDRFADWNVSQIGPRGIVLRAGARELIVSLYPADRARRDTDAAPGP